MLGGHDGVLAPAEVVQHEGPGGKALAADHLSDRAAVERLADLKRRDVGRTVRHAPAHVRIDRHPQVAHEHLAGPGLGNRGLHELEVLGLGFGLGAGSEADLTVDLRHRDAQPIYIPAMAIEPLPGPAAHPFERATAVVAAGPSRWRAQLDPDWFGSVAPHGGHLAAQLLRAMVAEVDNPELMARSLTVHFLTAGAPGPFATEVRIERAGRSLSAVSARAVQDGETLAVAMAALGRPRRGPAINAATRRVIPAPGELRGPSQSARARLPPVMGHYEMRYAFGAPRSGEEPASGGWVRPRIPLAPSDVLTTALCDTWMPSVYVALTAPEMTTTVELTVNFLASPEGLAVDGWYQVGFWTPAAGEGYFREEGEIWGADGRLLARCSQLAVFLGGRVPRRFAEPRAGGAYREGHGQRAGGESRACRNCWRRRRMSCWRRPAACAVSGSSPTRPSCSFR